MRNELERRPLLLACVGLIAGITAVEHPVNAALLVLIALFVRRFPARAALIVFLAIGVAVGPRIPVQGITQVVEIPSVATVVSVPKLYPDGCSAEVEVADAPYLLRYRGRAEISLGDQLAIQAPAKPFADGMDALYMHRLLVGRISADDSNVQVVRQGLWIYRLASSWRRSFVGFASNTLSTPTASMVDALCFNVDGSLDDAARDSLQNTGTIHVISASGLHVMVFAFALQWLLAMLPLPRHLQLLLLAVVLAFYACATGLRPPVIRAVAMALIYCGAYLVRREPDLLASLAVVATTFLLFRPEGVYDLGFQFSFVTVGAIGLFGVSGSRAADDLPSRVTGELKRTLRVGLVASAAAAPLTALYFGLVSIVCIPANLLIAPAIPAIVVLSLAAYALNPLVPEVSKLLMAGGVEPLTGWLQWVVNGFSAPAWSVARMPAISGYWVGLLYFAALLTWHKRVRHA